MAHPSTNAGGVLNEITDCYITIPGFGKIPMRILPDISDQKGAQYNDESVIGRSMPMKTFSHGENRVISWTAYFMICEEGDATKNLRYLRAIQSALYPRVNVKPYGPPPVCVISCGELLAAAKEVCAILKSYNVKFDTSIPWDETTKLPYKFSVDMTWELVYMSNKLPGSENILFFGR